MNIILLILGLSPTIIFMYKVDIMYKKKEGLLFFFFTFFMLIIGSILGGEGNKFIKILKLPFFNLLIFYFFHYCFYRMYNRFPVNTAWTSSKKPVEDVIFNLSYWVLGFFIPIILLF